MQTQQQTTDNQEDEGYWHSTLLLTKVLSTTATETLQSVKTTQTWFPNAT